MPNIRSELPPPGSKSAPKKSKSKILSLVDSPRYAPPMRDYIPHTKRRVTEENKTKDAKLFQDRSSKYVEQTLAGISQENIQSAYDIQSFSLIFNLYFLR